MAMAVSMPLTNQAPAINLVPVSRIRAAIPANSAPRARPGTPGEQLTGQIMGAVMSYVLVPEGSASRLLLKVVAARGRAAGPLLTTGDMIMSRRQLLNLAQLAEHVPER
jgi:hypothetical protein